MSQSEDVATVAHEPGEWVAIELECALSDLGLEWKKEDDVWKTSVTWGPHGRCDLLARATANGVRISTVLARAEGLLAGVRREAVGKFLGHANSRLRSVQTVLDDQEVRVESHALTDRLEQELPDSVFGVAAAFRALSREVRALLDQDLARAYVTVQG